MLFNKKYEPVTEAYIGKTNNLKQVERELEKVIIMVNEFSQINLDRAKFVNSSSACQKAADLLSNEFGTQIKLNFSPQTYANGGAYAYVTTTPFGAIHTNKEFMKTGKIKSHERVIPIFINVDFNLINKCQINAQELTAILLHEIGHNIRHITAIYSIANTIAFPAVVAMGTAYGILDRVFTHIVSLPIISQFIKFNHMFNNMVEDITGNRHNIPIALFAVLSFPSMIIRRADPVSYIMGYQAERYSDSLAAAYGYGPDLSKALLKMSMGTSNTTYNKVINSNKVTAFADTMLLAMYDLLVILLLDPHPATAHRVKNTLNKLERDLATNKYPPEVKSQLKADIATLKELYNDYLNATDAEKDETKAAYRQYVERYGVDPIRNLMLDKIYQKLEV